MIYYLAVASRSYLSNPKQPTIFVYNLDENNNYQVKSYQDNTPIISAIFPELKLTTQQIFSI
nr:Uma2 family endonuclease [Cyanobacterium aponinum]